jgi:heme a synthase
MAAVAAEAAVAARSGRLPAVSQRAFHRLSIVSLVMVCAIVLTGAAVRLTGSGLGCPDWPSCYQRRLTAQLSYHSMVEFSNRLVTVAVVVVIGITFLAALLRLPRRRDLTWLAAGLVAGVLGEAVLGGIVVYTKLNPYLVMVHLMASLLLVADAVVLVHRSTRGYAPGSGVLLVPTPFVWLSRGLLALLAVVVAAGTATTGAGPHAGDAGGQTVAKRIPIALRDMAELHSSLAILLVGVAIATIVALHAVEVPERVRRAGRLLVVALVAQAAVGYTQYFTHLPALLVEVHILGALVLVIGTVQFSLSLTHHPVEPVPVPVDEAVGAPAHEALQSVGAGTAANTGRAPGVIGPDW